MSDPILSGNRGHEQSQYETGVSDFSGVATSTLPEAGGQIEAQLEPLRDGIALIPLKRVSNEFKRGLGEFRESHTHESIRAVADEPETLAVRCADENRLAEVSKRGQREQLVWYGVRSSQLMAVTEDRIMVEQETLESEYSCRSCKGKGHTDQICRMCEGMKSDAPCANCVVLGFGVDHEYNSGHEKCSSCRGSGWRAGIIIPDIAQSLPSTGVVVSVGPKCQSWKLGDRVLHSKYAGHAITTPEKRTYTIMREHEVISLLAEVAK